MCVSVQSQNRANLRQRVRYNPSKSADQVPHAKPRRRAMEHRQIGKSVPRKEGREKVTGTARYVDDLTFPDMIHGVTVRTAVARGKALGIRFGEGIPWDEFTIVTARAIPGKNCVALLIDDQPCLAEQLVSHPEDAVVRHPPPANYLLQTPRRPAPTP